MMGKPGQPEQKGLIPRSLEQIFRTRQSLLPQGWKYEMQVSSVCVRQFYPFFEHLFVILLLYLMLFV